MITYREAGEGDLKSVLFFIRKLAEYERMADEVTATEALLRKWMFEQKVAECILADDGEKDIGFALYFYNFSTFQGKAGIYIEDIYVLPEYRGSGIGKTLISMVAAEAVKRGCGRVEWMCLDWNEPSIEFYRSIGAESLDDWTKFRLSGDALEKCGNDQNM